MRMPKQPTNLSIDSSLLEQARELVRRQRRELWLQENRAAVGAYNDRVEQQGVFSDRLRNF